MAASWAGAQRPCDENSIKIARGGGGAAGARNRARGGGAAMCAAKRNAQLATPSARCLVLRSRGCFLFLRFLAGRSGRRPRCGGGAGGGGGLVGAVSSDEWRGLKKNVAGEPGGDG